VGFALMIVAIGALAALPLAQATPFAGELGWGNGVLWTINVPPAKFFNPANDLAHEEFFEAAPQVPGMGFPASPQSSACDHLTIATVTPSSGSCSHDHIIPVPPGNVGDFRAVWHVFLVLCSTGSSATGRNACVPQTVTGTTFFGTVATFKLAGAVTIGGTLVPLTSVSAIEAAETAGLVTTFDTTIVFICPITPLG